MFDVVLALRRPVDWQAQDGARVEIHVEKARGLDGEMFAPIAAELRDGRWRWHYARPPQFTRGVALLELGLGAEQMGRVLGISRASAFRLQRQARQLGLGTAGREDAAVKTVAPFFRRSSTSVFRRLWKDETTRKCRRAALLAVGSRQCRSKTAKTGETTTSACVDYLDLFSATAARISALNAASSISSPSWMSMARRALPSRLELNRPDGSSSEAPLAKVSFTTAL